MERAEAFVREMEEEGIDATIDIYHTMMDGYTMIKNENKCLVVFMRLKVRYFFHCSLYIFFVARNRPIATFFVYFSLFL